MNKENNITAKVLAKSVSPQGKVVCTWEVTVHRYVWAQILTHRDLSRNAMSSRACSVPKMQEALTAVPIHWGKHQSGMQAYEEADNMITFQGADYSREQAWNIGKDFASELALAFHKADYAKQIVNRITEPYQIIKAVITSTDTDNFYWLRLANDPQHEIRELADKMKTSFDNTEAAHLREGEWHVPYVDTYRDVGNNGVLCYQSQDGTVLTAEEAKKVSASSIAQVSYRDIDPSKDKADNVFTKLGVGTDKVHSSPFESVLTPMTDNTTFETDGVTALHKVKGLMSGNSSGWIQFRHLIDNNTKY